MTRLWFGIGIAVTLTLGCRPDKPASTDEAHHARARVTESGLQADDRARSAGPRASDDDGDSSALSTAERQLEVARVGEVVITLGDLERRLGEVPAVGRERYAPLDKKIEFLDTLIQFELIAREAQTLGYDTHPDVVFAMKRAMIQKYTANDLQKLVKASRIEESEIERYYQNNQSLFVKPEQVRVSHILFKDKAKAAKILAELQSAMKADPARARTIFSGFARQHSKDMKTAHGNGDLGFFTTVGYVDRAKRDRPVLSEALRNASFAFQRLNQLSELVEDEQGVHILQLTNRRPGVNRTLESARRQITSTLLRQKKDTARKNYIEGLRKKADIVVHKDRLQKLDILTVRSRLGVLPPVPTLGGPGTTGVLPKKGTP
jgi:parvulin-like peptidyl-prolyl isomerase